MTDADFRNMAISSLDAKGLISTTIYVFRRPAAMICINPVSAGLVEIKPIRRELTGIVRDAQS
jgi:hypothetical protein